MGGGGGIFYVRGLLRNINAFTNAYRHILMVPPNDGLTLRDNLLSFVVYSNLITGQEKHTHVLAT